jgi:hypothetical protein
MNVVARLTVAALLAVSMTGIGCGGGGGGKTGGRNAGGAGGATGGGGGATGGSVGGSGATGGTGGGIAGSGGSTGGAPADGGTPDAFTPHDAGRAPSGHALVPGGTKSASASYVIVRTAGQSPGGNRVRSSASYKMVGGIVGATQK